MKKIPVYQPLLAGNEIEYVNNCLKTTWISSKGEYILKFEEEFAKYIDIDYATTVSNGTVALHLALLVLGIEKDDEIIVPTLTYIASINAISMVGAKPIFVDSNKDSWNMECELIESKITNKTKAIMAVHLYGMPCDMSTLRSICDKHNLYLIEDAAEAFGSKFDNKFTGTFGDISTFSFFGNKTITTGEGGMLVSNNQSFIRRAEYLKSQSVSNIKEYWHDEVGYNYRMTNICGAIGLAQLEQASEIIEKKVQIAQWYKSGLKKLPVTFQSDNPKCFNSFWMVSILAENKEIRDSIREYLKLNGIETRPLFYPAHTMPVFKNDEAYPISEFLSDRGMNLPSYPGLTKDDVDYICSMMIRTFNN
ncbi:MAG TPA: DegT/DnrJ/EryC1/StrS family aminotransferase [Daejeonella sp.]|uniref:DegT/DnrJ/EryC1/StrS family aminotransferase n=1 Tax=Daejeonella sp. TaxID=2805397 RepID=UPI002EDB23DD